MRITEEQKAKIDSLSCERLSSNLDNKAAIQLVSNKQNPNLVSYLQGPAWDEDARGENAFYLVKDQNGNILYFFAIKTGLLIENLNLEKLNAASEFLDKFKKYSAPETSQEDKTVLEGELRDLIKRYGFDIAQILTLNKKKNRLRSELAKEPNQNVNRVLETHSAVELCIFCANDACREEAKPYSFGHKMGVIVFWRFVLSQLLKLQRIAGCEYAYLFAADQTPDGFLVNYYKKQLHFAQDIQLGTSKPSYDYNCFFLCQTLEKLHSCRTKFFEEFNKMESEDMV